MEDPRQGGDRAVGQEPSEAESVEEEMVEGLGTIASC